MSMNYKSSFSFMSRTAMLMLSVLFTFSPADASGKVKAPKNAPVFSEFSYEGSDNIYSNNPIGNSEFYTTILQGCYPDPSICRKGDDYYLFCSSFAMFLGVPIFHSTALVHWKQLCQVLASTSQFKAVAC